MDKWSHTTNKVYDEITYPFLNFNVQPTGIKFEPS